jgi:anti-sigma regulatory factor (Ser/Thr protein kinase)
MDELKVDAIAENLPRIARWVRAALVKNGFGSKAITQTEIAIEEAFINICHYAYAPGTGKTSIRFSSEETCAVFELRDTGRAFNPLAVVVTDTSAPASQREEGGMGILMLRQLVSHLEYRYESGMNILRIRQEK